jgi:hypothetical protein
MPSAAFVVIAGDLAFDAGISSFVSQKRAKRVDDEAMVFDITVYYILSVCKDVWLG